MAAIKYPVPLPQLPQQSQTPGTPHDVIPDEQIEVVTTPIDLGYSAAVDPEIPLPNFTPAKSPLSLSTDELSAEVATGNAAITTTPSGSNTPAWQDLTHYLRDTVTGNWILVGAAAAVIVTLVVLITHWASSGSKLESTIQTAQLSSKGLSEAQAKAAQQTLANYVSDSKQILTTSGVSQNQATVAADSAQLSIGTQIGLLTHRDETSGLNGQSITVTGATGPNHYPTLAQLNIPRYLNTISANPTPQSIIENSAALKNLDTQSH
jgi:hypothetical protein